MKSASSLLSQFTKRKLSLNSILQPRGYIIAQIGCTDEGAITNWVLLSLSRPGGHFVPPHQNHSISSKQLGAWSFCFVTFHSMNFPFRKVQFHQSSLMYVAMATMQLFCLILKTWIFIVFQELPPEKNFLWDNLCFGHHNTLSLVEANIRILTVERF